MTELTKEEATFAATVTRQLSWFIFIILAIALAGCSHTSQVQSAEKSAATASKNVDLAKAAILMRVSDYGQEVQFAVSQMPPSPQVTAADEILSLQIQLAGAGTLSEQKRRDFVTKLIAAGTDAKSELAAASKKDDSLKNQLADKTEKLAVANTNLVQVSQSAATVADELDSWLHYFLIFLGLAGCYCVIRMILLWSQTAATVAARVP